MTYEDFAVRRAVIDEVRRAQREAPRCERCRIPEHEVADSLRRVFGSLVCQECGDWLRGQA